MTILYGIFLLSFLIFIHELGHFLAAKIVGVKVDAFSLGMGPVLLHKNIRNTDFRISALPFGGYCAMKGEKDEEFFDCPSDSLYGVKPIARCFIGFAGPFFNILFSFIAYSMIAFIGYTYFSAGNTIKIATDLYPEIHSPAADAGLLSGDRILNIDGKEIEDFSDIYNYVVLHGDEDLEISVERNSEIISFTVHTDLDKKTGEGKIGVVSDSATVKMRESKRYGVVQSLMHGFLETKNTLFMTFKSFSLFFKGVELKNTVRGPARITNMLGSAAKESFSYSIRNGLCSVLEFMALISVSLFIMNLLPIPILDGWLVFTSLFSLFFKIKLSNTMRNVVQFIGLSVIGFLFILALINDLKYFLGL